MDFNPAQASELHYWRKHPNLHGWMERLYREKGGTDEQFNCVALTAEDLDRLEADISSGVLPHTAGFFFGASTGDEDDLQFVGKGAGPSPAPWSPFPNPSPIPEPAFGRRVVRSTSAAYAAEVFAAALAARSRLNTRKNGRIG